MFAFSVGESTYMQYGILIIQASVIENVLKGNAN